MTPGRRLEDSLRWLDDGTTLFLRAADALDETSVRAPSLLPGWSRAHVLAHVGFNALALQNLVAWARTGVPTPMYASLEQRDRDIQRGAASPATELRHFVANSAAELADGVSELDGNGWAADVVTALGRTVAATEVPWMRAREVAVHAADLDTGVTFDDLPDDLASALILDAARRRTSLALDPPVQLETADGGSWSIGIPTSELTVAGSRPDLVAWITGRSEGTALRASTGCVPQLTRWL